MGPVRFQERKIGDTPCLRRPAPSGVRSASLSALGRCSHHELDGLSIPFYFASACAYAADAGETAGARPSRASSYFAPLPLRVLYSSVAVVFVNYTPSPEAKYPVAVEQAYAATKYIAENGSKMHLDSGRLAVAGDSVGGNMAAAVTLLAKQRGGPRIAYQALLYPVTDASLDTASYQQFANGPWLTKAAMEWFWNAYAPDLSIRKNSTVSPLQASLEELSGLPPALVITDENDVLRDQAKPTRANWRRPA